MTIRTLFNRLGSFAQVLIVNPGLVRRGPRFAWRALKEGPRASIDRMRAVINRLRLSLDYRAWQAEFGTTVEEKLAMRDWAQALPHPTQVAVLMPLSNPRYEWLQAAIHSVQAQLYPCWQLCIAIDSSTDQRIRLLLEAKSASEPRIEVVFCEGKGKICETSNRALELAKAPWVALLDQSDLLSDDALIWVAKAIQEHPEARLFYSDEDKIRPMGDLFEPYFKGQWNPLLMEGQNMFSHLGVYSADLMRQVGGFRQGVESSQDYDLVLRCSEQVRRDQIVHIPRVLYHVRVSRRSTALGGMGDRKESAARAIKEHLVRRCEPLQELRSNTFGFHAKRLLPDPAPRVSIIIPTRNGLNVLKPCLESLLKMTRYPDFEVLVVDNGSDDWATLQFLESLRQQEKIKVLHDPSSFNYSALNNRAVQEASGQLICLLNNDIEVLDQGWLEEMVVFALRPGVGAVGARLLFPNGKLQHAGVVLGLGLGGVAGHAHLGMPGDSPGYFSRAQLAQEISAVTAACLVVQRCHYLEVGGLDEVNLRVAFNDVDFCLKLKEQGLHNIYVPAARLIHHESASRGLDHNPEKAARFAQEVSWMHYRWSHLLQNDPAYNPNLSFDTPLFRLACPPRLNRWGATIVGNASLPYDFTFRGIAEEK
ncbi:glycosyltransferase family 2 protein [Cyanobium sp. T1B-Tous]|uniref:glycosyltransferase family 2 protein n=1 Tax=Cyanobium sp. T1B-Tous TaxID=2823721 RepID=UPI0020CEB259|nr:glycosyltransferase family 2 protein [Cyanobium sp. T1B-Tous]MCP9805806.1 glycosyltransferase family 2 protein [Cyanobium sp. T1B-Tous]